MWYSLGIENKFGNKLIPNGISSWYWMGIDRMCGRIEQ